MRPSLTALAPIVGITLLFVLGLPVFAVQYIRRGKPRTERISRQGGSLLLGTWLMEYGYWFLSGPARLFVRLGISPDALSLLGLGVIALGSVAVGMGLFGLGGWLILFGAMLDAVDGMVARQTGVSSDAGEFLDAVVDRYAEIASYVGLCYYYNEQPVAMGVVLAALLGSLMLSYNRAKAESLGVANAPSGLMRRHERALYVGLGIALSPVASYFIERNRAHPIYPLALVACTLVAVLANASALKMAAYVKRTLQARKE